MCTDWPIPQFDPQLCDGCGRCVVACSHHALRFVTGMPQVVDPQRCQYDGCCELACRRSAITRPFLLTVAPAKRDTPTCAVETNRSTPNGDP